ncbi:MAG: NAD(P)H-dependent flavin oxidoreductase [Candidatus Velthaea sp.]
MNTLLTGAWGLRYPILGAPMAGVAGGALARAISVAGGLGMIGIGSTDPLEKIARESAVAAEGGVRFGIGLMGWALERRPDALDATIAAKPFLVSVSFGTDPAVVGRLHDAGILVCAQVNTADDALRVERAGVDVIVAQGTEAGGHTGDVGTLPLLQIVLDRVRKPVLASGGIATGRGVAAVIAAGAEGAWIGTAFTATAEAQSSAEARATILAAREDQTVLTSLFDRMQGIPWPRRYPGRALANDFTARWHERPDEAAADPAAREDFERARAARDFRVAYIYAGQAVGMVDRERPAGDVVREIGDETEARLAAFARRAHASA